MPEYPDPDSRNVLEPDCSRCPALVDTRERIAWGNGSLDAAVMIVGEAPAAGNPDADRWRGGNRTGLAYTSEHSGRRIRALFADAGFEPGDCYLTNAVKCFPEGSDGSNREPTADERANCRSHLRAEIEAVDPAVVAPTGKHATLSVLACGTPEDSRMGERRGGDPADRLEDGFLDAVLDPVEVPAFDATVLPLVHPSYQDVWLARLGYSREGYVAAIRDAVVVAR